MQDKKKAEAERAKELAELFAVAIKQPKVPAGVCMLRLLLPPAAPKIACIKLCPIDQVMRSSIESQGANEEILKKAVCAGVDPKSILCEFFRHGQCAKGFKCKFSHDLNVERKGGKIDIFSDRCAPHYCT